MMFLNMDKFEVSPFPSAKISAVLFSVLITFTLAPLLTINSAVSKKPKNKCTEKTHLHKKKIQSGIFFVG